MAKSLIVAGSVGSASSTAGTVTYWSVIGYVDKTTSATDKEMPINTAGTLSKLSIHINSTSVSGGAVTFTLLKNGSATALTVTTANPPVAGYYEDLTNSVSVTAGDKFVLKADPGSTTGTHNIAHIQMLFEPTDNTKTHSFLGAAHGSTRSISSASSTWFYPVTTYLDTLNTTEANHQIEMRVSGTFKNLSVNVSANARTTNTVFKLRKNGADTGLTVTYGSGETGRKNDTSNTVSVAANDLICLAITTSTGTQTLSLLTYNIEFENADTPNGVFLLTANNYVLGAQSRNQTLYVGLVGYSDLIAAETTHKMRLVEGGFTARNIGCRISTNSINTTSNLYLRVNGADSALVAPITSTQTGWLEDTTNSVSLSAGDEIAGRFLIGTGSGSQTIALRNWSIYLDAVSIRALTATISDSVTISHTTNDLRNKIRTRSDSLSLSESIPRLRLLLQASSDAVTIGAGSPVNLRGLIQTSSDSVTISESISRLRGLARLRADSMAFTEGIVKDMIDRVRLLSDSLTLNHTTTRLRALNQASSDSLTFSDTRSRLSTRIRTISESLVLSESISRLKSINRTVSAGSIGLSETNSRLVNKVRTLSESVGFSHGLSRLTNRLRTITDIISLISDTVRERIKTGQINESLEFSESVNRLTTRLKTISQSLTLSDAVLGLRGLLQTNSDSLSFSEDIQKLRNKVRVTSESLTLSSSIERLRLMLRLLDQSINLSDNLIYQTSRLRGFTQNLSLSEVIETGGANLVKSISESLDFSESVSRSTTRLRTISDSLGLTDSISRIRTKLRTMSHSVTLSETISQSKEFVKTISETLSLTDSGSRLLSRVRQYSDALSLSSVQSRSLSRLRSISQTLSLTDSFVQDALSSVIKTISEELTISDGAQRTKGKLKTITDTLSLSSDTVKNRLHRIKIISETLNISDSTSRMRLFIMRSISQNLGLSSTIFRETKSAVKNFTIKIRRFKLFRYT